MVFLTINFDSDTADDTRERLSKIVFCLVAAAALRSTAWLFQRGRINLTGKLQSAASPEAATVTAAATAPKWKRHLLCRHPIVPSN